MLDAWTVAEVASVAWGNDSRTLFYVTMDAAKRANRLWCHAVDSDAADLMLFEEARRAVQRRRGENA